MHRHAVLPQALRDTRQVEGHLRTLQDVSLQPTRGHHQRHLASVVQPLRRQSRRSPR